MKLTLKTLVLAVSAAAGVMLDPSIARAATITYSFTGSVTGVDNVSLGGAFSAGDALTGTFVFDTDAIGSSCSPACAFYLSPAQVFSATVGSYSFSGTGYGQIYDQGVVPGGSNQEVWTFGAGAHGTPISGPAVNGLALREFSLSLGNASGGALSGLSYVPPVFGDYQTATLALDFGTSGLDKAYVYATITSLSVVEPTPPTPPAVPEPATIGLLATGLVGLAVRRRASSRP